MTNLTTPINEINELVLSEELLNLKEIIKKQSPDKDTLKNFLVYYTQKGQEDCVKYILENDLDINDIYYDLLYHSSNHQQMNLLHLFIEHAPEDIYINNDRYLFLLLGGFSTGKFEACLLLIKTFFIKNEHLQEYLDESFSTIIRIDALSPSGLRTPDNQMADTINALESLLHLGAKYDHQIQRSITSRMQKIVDALLLKQKISSELNQDNNQTKESKNKL